MAGALRCLALAYPCYACAGSIRQPELNSACGASARQSDDRSGPDADTAAHTLALSASPNHPGDIYGLFTEEPLTGAFTEWRLIAQCYTHGQVSNTVATPASQVAPSSIAFVLCPECLVAGIRRRLEPCLVMKLTEEK